MLRNGFAYSLGCARDEYFQFHSAKIMHFSNECNHLLFTLVVEWCELGRRVTP
jgi:hypothetical protein